MVIFKARDESRIVGVSPYRRGRGNGAGAVDGGANVTQEYPVPARRDLSQVGGREMVNGGFDPGGGCGSLGFDRQRFSLFEMMENLLHITPV
jgi:hypothetical protein